MPAVAPLPSLATGTPIGSCGWQAALYSIDAAVGCRDLNQVSRVCVHFFEELGGSVMMPRGLIGDDPAAELL